MEDKRKSRRRSLYCRHTTLNSINRMCASITLIHERWGWAAKSNIRSAASIRGEKGDDSCSKEGGKERRVW